MKVQPKLIPVSVPAAAEAAVVVLHGGGSRARGMTVSPTQLSVLRMIPISHAVARAGRGRLAVFRLLNSYRGWDASHTPVTDVGWAIGEVHERLGSSLSVGLVGHSLGGRAALLCAGHQGVRSVVALAPWVLPADDRPAVDGVDVLFVHGTADRIASPQRSMSVARAMRGRGGSVTFIGVDGAKHAMLRRHGAFSSLAARFCSATLLDTPPEPFGIQFGGDSVL